jgi:hypothetical protein
MAVWAALHPDKISPESVRATLALWYVNGTGFNPFWAWWKIGLISLAPIPGHPPAERAYPAAAYQLFSILLNRSWGEPNVDGEGEPPMDKVEFTYQFHGVDDEQARAIAGLAVTAMTIGAMPTTIRTNHDRTDWARRLSRITSDFHSGRLGKGPKRRPLEVDPETGWLTGVEVEELVEA